MPSTASPAQTGHAHTDAQMFQGICICSCPECTRHVDKGAILCTCPQCPPRRCGCKSTPFTDRRI